MWAAVGSCLPCASRTEKETAFWETQPGSPQPGLPTQPVLAQPLLDPTPTTPSSTTLQLRRPFLVHRITRNHQFILYLKLPNQLSRQSFTHRYSSIPRQSFLAPHFRGTMAEILNTANGIARYKLRSLEDAREHLKTVEDRGHEVVVALLGDSLIHRMTTTGQCYTLDSWPSPAIASDSDIQAMNDAIADTDATPISRMEGIANFGCGGDKIQNILYRVVGETNLEGLGHAMRGSGPPKGGIVRRWSQKMWVIHAGTNNLHPKQGLRDVDLRAMDVLLRTLHHLSRRGTKFLVTGLFYRKDIPRELVDKANVDLQDLVARLDQELPEAPQSTQGSHNTHSRVDSGISAVGSSKTTNQPHIAGQVTEASPAWDRENGTVRFLPAPRMGDDLEDWLEDKVHLHLHGYQKWMRTLLPKIHEMLPRSLPPSTPERQDSPPPSAPQPSIPPPSAPPRQDSQPRFNERDDVHAYYPTDSIADGQEGSL